MNGIDDVKLSFGRCLLGGDIIGRFYEIFLGSHADVAPRFANTDFSTQKNLLNHGINLALMFADDRPVGVVGLNRIKQSHSKSAMDIDPALYPYWKESFIKAVAELDPEFSDALQARWDTVLQKAIDHIVGGRDVERTNV